MNNPRTPAGHTLQEELAKYKRLYEDAHKQWTDALEAINEYCAFYCNYGFLKKNKCLDDCPLKEHRT